MIYHYTTIETLALILSNKKIRFSRLDKVDDIEEAELLSGPNNIKLGQYVFASCWTRFAEENISLWKMYSGYDGVRISLPESNIFKSYDITPEFPNSDKSYFKSPCCAIGKDAVCFTRINPIKCEDIVYTDDPNLLAKNTIVVTNTYTALSSSFAGKYKRKIWEFQKECRFKFMVFPVQEEVVANIDKFDSQHLEQQINLSLLGYKNITHQKPISQDHIDISLSDTAMDNLQVMLGPKTSVAQEVMIKALLNQYAPKAILKYSQIKLRK